MKIRLSRPSLGLALLVLTVIVTVGGVASVPAATTAIDISTEFRPHRAKEPQLQIPNSMSNARVPAAGVPRPASSAIQEGTGASVNVDGVNFFEHRFLTDGGNQFSLEPPDPATCVGNGHVISAVNTTFQIYTTGGAKVGSTVSLNRLYFNESAIVRTPVLTYGRFSVGDPKCHYDPDIQRWVMTVYALGTNPATGALTNDSAVAVAVSKSNVPSTNRNDWWIYVIDTTNDGTGGTPSHPTCPCIADQPLLGFDDYGIYISTNEFDIAPFGGSFNGAQLYALDKVAAAAGTLNVTIDGPDVQLIDGTPIQLAEGPAYSLQPAVSPPGGAFETGAGGTEYFLSALDFDATLDNRIAVWALTNTSSLASGTPAVELEAPFVLSSQTYGQPPDTEQAPGPIPLGEQAPELFVGKPAGVDEKLNLLAGNDDRMQMVTFADGKLWSSLNTVVKTENGPTKIGSAWFIVDPNLGADGAVSGSMVNQGYVSRNRESVFFPAVGVNADGEGAMVFTIVGETRFPSAGYVTLDENGTGPIRILKAGTKPADGFTGYSSFGGSRTERWGDYHAAFADEGGDIWMTAEYIPGTFGFPPALANWGTSLSEVQMP